MINNAVKSFDILVISST